MIFGRAGEEIESLRKADIPYEIVPGVTSALGRLQRAEIPLDSPPMLVRCCLLTAHQASGKRSG